MLYNLKEVLAPSIKGGYSVPAFNTWSFEEARAIIRGAEELRSPVILMTSGSAVKNWTIEIAADIIKNLAKKSRVPVVLHLDHASDFDLIYKAMFAGYTSIMYDGSLLDFEENVKNSQIVVACAHSLGISVEAELGQIGRGEEGEVQEEILTEPNMVEKFLDRVKVDALAVAIGTCHGMQKQEANVNLALAESICDRINYSTPLVLHGSSGVKNEDLEFISKIGFGKVNFGTKLRNSYFAELKRIVSVDDSIKEPIKLFTQASEIISEIVKDKISHLGSEGKA